MKNKALLNGTEEIEQVRNKNKPRFSFSTLSLRRKKKNKPDKLTVEVEAKENDYEVIDNHLITTKSVPRNTDQTLRPRILNPDEALLSPLLTTINDNPQLKEILNNIRFSDLSDQIQLIQQFSKGLITNVETIDYIKIITQVDSSLNAIIEDLKIAEDKCIYLKNLALQHSLYLFEHDLWHVFIPKEEDYEIIEGDYEIMGKITQIEEECRIKPNASKERVEPDYVNIQDSGYLDMTLFRRKQPFEKEELESPLSYQINEIKNLN